MNKIDEQPIKQACAYFASKGFKTHITDNEFDSFDIILVAPNGDQYAVEVKGRNCYIHDYPDMRLDRFKYIAAQRAIENGFKAALVINVYADGSLGIGNILNGKPAEAVGPKTTHFSDRTWVTKSFWDVPRRLEVIDGQETWYQCN